MRIELAALSVALCMSGSAAMAGDKCFAIANGYAENVETAISMYAGEADVSRRSILHSTVYDQLGTFRDYIEGENDGLPLSSCAKERFAVQTRMHELEQRFSSAKNPNNPIEYGSAKSKKCVDLDDSFSRLENRVSAYEKAAASYDGKRKRLSEIRVAAMKAYSGGLESMLNQSLRRSGSIMDHIEKIKRCDGVGVAVDMKFNDFQHRIDKATLVAVQRGYLGGVNNN